MQLTLNTLPVSSGARLETILRNVRNALRRKPAAVREGDTQYELGKRAIVALLDPHGCRIECLTGCVWITQDGGQQDVLIDAGQNFLASGKRRVLIYALAMSSMRIIRGCA